MQRFVCSLEFIRPAELREIIALTLFSDSMQCGFTSPAADYVERALSLEIICQVDGNSLIIETSTGYAVINRALRCQAGKTALIRFCGASMFAKVLKQIFITDDGDAIEGEALADVEMNGVVSFYRKCNRITFHLTDYKISH